MKREMSKSEALQDPEFVIEWLDFVRTVEVCRETGITRQLISALRNRRKPMTQRIHRMLTVFFRTREVPEALAKAWGVSDGD